MSIRNSVEKINKQGQQNKEKEQKSRGFKANFSVNCMKRLTENKNVNSSQSSSEAVKKQKTASPSKETFREYLDRKKTNFLHPLQTTSNKINEAEQKNGQETKKRSMATFLGRED